MGESRRRGISESAVRRISVLRSSRIPAGRETMEKYMNAGVREYWIVDRKREKIVCYWFEGEDAPEISMYTFRDKVPVRIYDGQLEIDFPEIMQRLWKEE